MKVISIKMICFLDCDIQEGNIFPNSEVLHVWGLLFFFLAGVYISNIPFFVLIYIYIYIFFCFVLFFVFLRHSLSDLGRDELKGRPRR